MSRAFNATPHPRLPPPGAPPPPGRESWRPTNPTSAPSLAPTGQSVRATKQKIHSYTNANQHYLQERIPPNKPFIGLRTAYRPGYAICVIIAGCINIISGIIMTALAYSRLDKDNVAAAVLRVLGPVVLVIGVIFLACGLCLLFHYRHTKKKAKWAREHGKGPIEPIPRRYPGPPRAREYQDRHGTQLPTSTPTVDNYSYYSASMPRHRDEEDSRRLQRPIDGDWKYVSDLRDATLSPKYPREQRKPLDGIAANKHKLYPYDHTFNSQAPTRSPATPKTTHSQRRDREQNQPPDRRY